MHKVSGVSAQASLVCFSVYSSAHTRIHKYVCECVCVARRAVLFLKHSQKVQRTHSHAVADVAAVLISDSFHFQCQTHTHTQIYIDTEVRVRVRRAREALVLFSCSPIAHNACCIKERRGRAKSAEGEAEREKQASRAEAERSETKPNEACRKRTSEQRQQKSAWRGEKRTIEMGEREWEGVGRESYQYALHACVRNDSVCTPHSRTRPKNG